MTNTIVDHATAKPTTQILLVGPETAERWLLSNTSNRSIRPAHVKVLARDMEAGHWQMTGEAIKFDRNGSLIDGQHRLTAVIESGAQVQMLVVFGLLPESQQAMDAGARRSASDALDFAGRTNTAVLAHAVRCAIAWEGGNLRTVGSQLPSVSNSEIVTYVDLNPEIVAAASGMTAYRMRGRSVGCGVFVRHAVRKIDRAAADEMFDRIIDNRTNGAGDPVNAFINRMISSRSNSERLTHPTEIHMLFRTWNAIRSGEALHRIQISAGQPIAVPK